MVAPTLEGCSRNEPPSSRPPGAEAITYPSSSSMSAPNAFMPLMCRSTGRGPQAQPPGSETLASPQRPIRAPSM